MDCFLRITGVDGESVDSTHRDEIAIRAWSWGAKHSDPSSAASGSRGPIGVEDFSFTTVVSKASSRLILAAMTAERFDEAVLVCRKSGGQQFEYLKIRFIGVVVSSFQVGVTSDSDNVQSDRFTLGFSRFFYEYRLQKNDGSPGPTVRTGYDLITNTPC